MLLYIKNWLKLTDAPVTEIRINISMKCLQKGYRISSVLAGGLRPRNKDDQCRSGLVWRQAPVQSVSRLSQRPRIFRYGMIWGTKQTKWAKGFSICKRWVVWVYRAGFCFYFLLRSTYFRVKGRLWRWCTCQGAINGAIY